MFVVIREYFLEKHIALFECEKLGCVSKYSFSSFIAFILNTFCELLFNFMQLDTIFIFTFSFLSSIIK